MSVRESTICASSAADTVLWTLGALTAELFLLSVAGASERSLWYDIQLHCVGF